MPDGTNPFLDDADLAFNLWHVLVGSGDIQVDAKIGEVVLEGTKFPVHADFNNFETALVIDGLDVAECREDIWDLGVL